MDAVETRRQRAAQPAAVQAGPVANVWLTVGEVARLAGVKPRTIWRWVKESDFPPPTRITRKTTRWNAVVLDAYMSKRTRGPL